MSNKLLRRAELAGMADRGAQNKLSAMAEGPEMKLKSSEWLSKVCFLTQVFKILSCFSDHLRGLFAASQIGF